MFVHRLPSPIKTRQPGQPRAVYFHLYSREALMKRIQKFLAVNVVAALIGAGVPAIAAERGHDTHGRSEIQSHVSERRGDRDGNNDRNRHYENDNRRDRSRDDNRRDYDRGYIYAPAPVYRGPVYDNGYYDRDTHNGRTAAIIGGSAAAGAVIGAAVGHGQGAVIGAVIGGIAGTVASTAANQHDRY